MNRVSSLPEFQTLQVGLANDWDETRPCLRVCDGTGCRALGSHEVLLALRGALAQAGLAEAIEVVGTGCPGFCECGPLITVYPQRISYQRVRPADVQEIVQKTMLGGEVIERLLYTDPQTGAHIHHEPDLPFYRNQQRLVLALNGRIDPTRIEDYLACGGYRGLVKALSTLTPEEVIGEVRRSGLRGRGGAGFPTARKWELCRENVLKTGEGTIICNADEGDPGAFMDRSILEGNPHAVIEGMLIGAYAMGVRRGYLYIRAEYPLAVENLTLAIEQARAAGFLGKDILGSGFDFDLFIRLGAGAFVCGEETALIASIEGRIGEPRPRPPYPAVEGLWGKPTNINNVKTWASVPLILWRGADWYAGIGTAKSKGTVVFSVVGKIHNTGLVEAPMGITLRQLIFDIGGGIRNGRRFKAVQIGGPSGGCIPAEHLDVSIDYESLTSLGAIVGSGGLVVADEDTCIVDFARYFMSFTQQESCGKCVPCRLGTRAMLATLERICAGNGQPGDVEYLQELGEHVRGSSLCALGQTAPNPVLSSIRYFRAEYDAHILEKRCPAHVCKALITYSIDAEKCNGCMLCLRNCTAGAIEGAARHPHQIHSEVCTRCGVCYSLCQSGAVSVS